uniref:Coiled-coil and C2 domain-containing protein 1B n=1 Tax=Ornithorhynchus anatinus TaxID=9258 RepID=A0A6I8NRZ4_ORNAN
SEKNKNPKLDLGRGSWPGPIQPLMGLLMDISPDGMMLPEDGDNDADLEAEFMALVGAQPPSREKVKGKAPLPMEAIEKMANLCMKDLDEEDGEEDEEDLEEDDDLLRLDERVQLLFLSLGPPQPQTSPSSLETTLTERLAMYQTAIANAKETGDGAKLRRYERGLKTLENQLASVRKGRSINEEDIPPPVAVGKSGVLPVAGPASPEAPPSPAQSTNTPQPSSQPPPAPPAAPPLALPKPMSSSTLALLQHRQREYKLAALQSKQQGDNEMATKYYRVAKSFDAVLDALSKGEAVDLAHLPPPPGRERGFPLLGSNSQLPAGCQLLTPSTFFPEMPPPPKNRLEALQQRMDRYRMAAVQAKSKGDERKARMHERIVKQYQDAIRALKAGKTVDVTELPVPPGFPPIQGLEASAPAEQSLVGVLETAMRLANQEDGDDEEETRKVRGPRPAPSAQPKPPALRAPLVTTAPAGKAAPKGSTKAQQQLEFLEGRKKQLMQAALRAKQKNDMEGAKMFLRQAKGLEPMLEASHNGLPVDITKVPPAPVNKEDFMLPQRRGASMPPEATGQYAELTKLMKQQHEMCLSYSNQFTHLGNVTETSKFEKMAEDCRKNMEILKQAHAKGFPLPKYHYEQRTFNIVKIFPELNSNDMVLYIVKGINLPAPSGVSPSDLDAFVRFDFPYPNAEEAQKDKTNVIKNTDSPEFKEQFKLFINRGHRGFKRAVQTKGIKFEVIHKGGLFKNDRVLGTAQLKLEALESACEIREILEILDGRRPTGGRLEVIVRLREPLTSQQLETTTEKWLVIDPLTLPLVRGPLSVPRVPLMPAFFPPSTPIRRPARMFQSLSVLAFDRERLERKIVAYKQACRPVPGELVQKYQDVLQRSQWQKAQLEQGGPSIRREYVAQLEHQLHYYTDNARRLGSDGNRVRLRGPPAIESLVPLV